MQPAMAASGMAKRNVVSGNSYTGSSAVCGGILVVGGGYFGSELVRGLQIMQNELTGNDVGVYLAQYEADLSAPAAATNIKVVNNVISNGAVTNGYAYQAGVSDSGNNDNPACGGGRRRAGDGRGRAATAGVGHNRGRARHGARQGDSDAPFRPARRRRPARRPDDVVHRPHHLDGPRRRGHALRGHHQRTAR